MRNLVPAVMGFLIASLVVFVAMVIGSFGLQLALVAVAFMAVASAIFVSFGIQPITILLLWCVAVVMMTWVLSEVESGWVIRFAAAALFGSVAYALWLGLAVSFRAVMMAPLRH